MQTLGQGGLLGAGQQQQQQQPGRAGASSSSTLASGGMGGFQTLNGGMGLTMQQPPQELGGLRPGGSSGGGAAGVGGLTFDMNEFPALASRVGSMSLNDSGQQQQAGGGTDLGGQQQQQSAAQALLARPPPPSHAEAASSHLQQQPPPPQGGGGGGVGGQGAQPGEFAIQQEDFPALPGTVPPPSPKQPAPPTAALQAGLGAAQQPPTTREGAGGGGGAADAAEASKAGQQQAATPGGAKGDQYGLLGLLSVIRMTDPDLNTLALGSDLTTLGLNLNASEALYTTFASPWVEGPTTRDPKFFLPQCYNLQKQSLKLTHFSKFQNESLFYIFYAMPKDALQAYAAEELYRRDWRFHKEMKLWIKEEAAVGFSGKAQYWYFDINHWEKRLFPQTSTANLTAIASGLLSEDDVRMHFPAGGPAAGSGPGGVGVIGR